MWRSPRVPSRRAAPVMGRVAGLPAAAVERLSSPLAAAAADDARLEARLRELRAALADRLHDVVPALDAPRLRRFALAVRRDCHNGRPLAPRVRAPEWAALADAAGPLAHEAAALAERSARRVDAFREAYDAEHARARGALLELVRRPDFLRALALASDDLSRAAAALLSPRGRADAGAEAALLRYATRMAVKVSPFSTFTRVALGAVGPGAGRAGLRLRGGEREGRSLLRLRRFRLQQCLDALARVPAFRDGLAIAFNDSAVETGPGRLLLLRPGRWEPDAAGGALRLSPDDLVRTGPSTPGVEAAARVLARGPLPYGDFAAALARESTGAADPAPTVDGLLALGVVRLAFPWPVHEGHLEKAVLAYLGTRAGEPALAPFAGRLRRLVELEDGFAASADPAAAAREMRLLPGLLWEAAAAAAGIDPHGTAHRGAQAFDLYEDVLEHPAGRPTAPSFRLSRRVARRAMESAAPLLRVAALFDRRHELGATLAAFAAARWPGRSEVPVLELFSAAQPLWRDWLRLRAAEWKDGERTRRWNPHGLPALDALGAWRERVHAGLAGCAVRDGDAWRVDEDAIEALLDGVPAAYTAFAGRGACLFLQPASTDGSLWRLNSLREGTGRCGSRYTPLLPGAARGRYAAHLAARGTARVDGERAFLLDVQCIAGDTINVHDPLSPAALAFPGDWADVPPHRRVRLGELRACLGGPRGPVLRDGSGRRLLPVHLGLAFEAYIPSIARFLCAFGPGEMAPLLPPRRWRDEGEVRVADRVVLGSLVIHRRGWSAPAAPLAAALAQAHPADAFAAVNRLRAAWGIPERVFVQEPVPHGALGTLNKPQYLDFSSPLFLPLLRAAAARDERVAFDEMLPTPEMCPPDPAGERRAVEVMVDSIALRRPDARPRAAAATIDAHTGRTPAASAAG